ncbi:MAG: response regulator [Gemmatimonadales bacterium]|nr:response regulator [Gemmatimonadales bacterium]
MSSESQPERRPAPRGLALVVDDDPAMRTLVKDLLAWEEIGARELPSGEGLIEAVEQEEVTLVVLDKEMPGASGLDLVAYVRRRRPGLPVIVITAFGGSGVRAEAMRLGATAYLDKPFRVGDFLQLVRGTLGSSAPGCGNSERAGGR